MDPLSLAAGLIGTSQLGTKLAVQLYTHAENVKPAPQELTHIATQVENLVGALSRISNLVQMQSNLFTPKLLEQINTTIDAAQFTMSRLSEMLKESNPKDPQLKNRIFWARRKDKLASMSSRLENVKMNILLIESVVNIAAASLPKLEPFKKEVLSIFVPNTNQVHAESVSDQNSRGGLFLILCEATSGLPNTMPFAKDTFISIVTKLKLPPGFVRALFTGFILRTPMSLTENWTLALSWDAESRKSRGIIHGLQSEELSRLMAHLGDTHSETCHPMNLPVILCEMLTESDSQGIKRRAAQLYDVEIKTNFHGYPKLKTAEDDLTPKTPAQEFEEMTRSLNTIISRLAFYEMRIHAKRAFIEQIDDRIKNMLIVPHRAAWFTELQSSTRYLRERLTHLRTEHQGLLFEIACNQKIAQSQLQIVYNLVAQRDNRDNRNLAEISTEIAITTKDDSFAMRTIAIMSIIFLPGTFVASFFSMSMFNWQASKAEPVVSSRFWIYWAVTLPLTIAVFLGWYIWLRTHRTNDRYNENLRTRMQTQGTRELVGIPKRHEKREWPWKKRRNSEARDEEMKAVGLGKDEATTTATDILSPGLGNFDRALMVQAKRADTIPLAPRR
ncbi:hypothetical protein EJ04DRAFT_556623 [Polyplosphaeria fusca]|uniref:Fungal N-terminal domain-containing protein n=1 Tax=Polyplosphaeria fusca TaxID=682080 RepID=A0A9P4QPJ6_9PLEO|nr:hypothetical protein EJ04DRAFT_556623 [Polyplosphaeria fusca]